MKQPNIMPRLNDRILKEEENAFLDLTGEALPSLKLDTFGAISSKELMAGTMAKHIKYLTSHKDETKLHVLTCWIVADLETSQGLEIFKGALGQIKTSTQLRLGVIFNHGSSPGLATRAVKAAIDSQSNTFGARNILLKILKELKNLETGKKKMEDFDIPGADMEAFVKAFKNVKDNDEVFEIHRIFVDQGLVGFTKGQNGVILNGRIIGPFDNDEAFGTDDFNLLEKFSIAQFGEKMVNALYNNFDVKSNPDISNLAMKLTSLLLSRPESTKTRHQVEFSSDKHSVIKIDALDKHKPAFDLVAIMDPLSQGSQKIVATLQVLSKVVNAKIRVFFNCVDKHSQLPQKSYFRLVLEPELTFTPMGELASGPMAKFVNLPEEPIFTMHYHIPDNWLIEPVKSAYDLDNIKLANVEGLSVHSEFELEYLLLEGHCFEAYTGNPPRGLQLTLGTKIDPVVVDTIVMANLGYLQLKSSPGRWLLRLREGRSSDLYDITSIDGKDVKDVSEDMPILISSFQSKIVKLKVTKKADKHDQDLLEGDGEKADESIWGSITSTFSGK